MRRLSSAACPVKLSDGNWFLIYNVDNKWPVVDPKPLPRYGRCALGWAVLDKDDPTRVLARSDAPLLYAELPWETSSSIKSVYTDGIKAEGDDTFVIFAGAADTDVEAVRVKVTITHDASGTRTSSVENGRVIVDGRPFYMIGSYVHALNATDWARLSDGGQNCVLTYTNGNAKLSYNLSNASLDGTRAFLDAASAHGMLVLLSLKDYYPRPRAGRRRRRCARERCGLGLSHAPGAPRLVSSPTK